MMSTKNKLKDRRTELELTLQEVADIVGVSKATIQRYESGNIKNMSGDKLALYAKALKVAPVFIMEAKFNEWDATCNKDGELAKEVKRIENGLPKLTPKDEEEIAKDLARMIANLDHQNGMAAFNDQEDEEDKELLKASLETSMRLAKQIAKKKFTPKKYAHEE